MDAISYREEYTQSVYMLHSSTRSMQGMFGASVSELYLLIKSLINIGRAVDLCVIKKNIQSVHRNCESGLAMIYKHAAHRLVQPGCRSWRWH